MAPDLVAICQIYVAFKKNRGAPKKKKMKATYIWQMINYVGRYLLFF
jgi:hypothetical protein